MTVFTLSSKSHWAPRLSLGLAAVDAAHRDLLDELARLASISDAEFPESYALFVAQVEKDFREEEDLMEASNFSGLPSHREQHARVLGGLH
ncbi:MAG: bacteriohemerythrin, partial [Burkholderiaceae bacterium]